MVATVDHISGGRVELGLGAGWNQTEHEAYGFPFPELAERIDQVTGDDVGEGHRAGGRRRERACVHVGRHETRLALRSAHPMRNSPTT